MEEYIVNKKLNEHSGNIKKLNENSEQELNKDQSQSTCVFISEISSV